MGNLRISLFEHSVEILQFSRCDTTPYACDQDLKTLIQKTWTWFSQSNYVVWKQLHEIEWR